MPRPTLQCGANLRARAVESHRSCQASRASLRQAILRRSWHAGPSNHRSQCMARPGGHYRQATESVAAPQKVLDSIVAQRLSTIRSLLQHGVLQHFLQQKGCCRGLYTGGTLSHSPISSTALYTLYTLYSSTAVLQSTPSTPPLWSLVSENVDAADTEAV